MFADSQTAADDERRNRDASGQHGECLERDQGGPVLARDGRGSAVTSLPEG